MRYTTSPASVSASALSEGNTENETGHTREEILKLLLQSGPLTAARIAQEFSLTATGVRRHLDNLVDQGLVTIDNSRQPSSRGRGRPARAFAITATGRSRFGHDYDSLARHALQTLKEVAGQDAIETFARDRAHEIVKNVHPAASDPDSVEDSVTQIADAFRTQGYAVTVQHNHGAIQLCQHHCPIAKVAADFPELCLAEHEAIADLTGTHVQPLATIPDGHGVCTTNIPLLALASPITHP